MSGVTPVKESTSEKGNQPSGRQRVSSHPTATRLLETVDVLLDDLPIDDLTVQLILERSGVSYGSLNHTYLDIVDLVEQALGIVQDRPRLAEKNARIQQEVTDAVTEFVGEFQCRN